MYYSLNPLERSVLAFLLVFGEGPKLKSNVYTEKKHFSVQFTLKDISPHVDCYAHCRFNGTATRAKQSTGVLYIKSMDCFWKPSLVIFLSRQYILILKYTVI